jgi:hypothetical protein
MYDPSIGRWTSEDPIGFDAGDPDLYRYVQNMPTEATDPSGDKIVYDGKTYETSADVARFGRDFGATWGLKLKKDELDHQVIRAMIRDPERVYTISSTKLKGMTPSDLKNRMDAVQKESEKTFLEELAKDSVVEQVKPQAIKEAMEKAKTIGIESMHADVFLFQLRMRASILKALASFQELHPKFSFSEGLCTCNEHSTYWEPLKHGAKQVGIKVKEGKSRALAIRELFTREADLKLDCGSAIDLIWLKGILDAVEGKVFDAMFKEIALGGKFGKGLSQYTAILYAKSPNVLLPGDRTSFNNPAAFSGDNIVWQNENVLVAENKAAEENVYFGHPKGNKTADKWIELLNEQRDRDVNGKFKGPSASLERSTFPRTEEGLRSKVTQIEYRSLDYLSLFILWKENFR